MKFQTTIFGKIARIVCIAAILFISLFALDAFEHGETTLEKLASFGMHMIPSFVLTILLFIAWKKELLGGALIMTAGLLTMPYIYSINYNRTHSVALCLQIISLINLPFIITGALFIYSHHILKRKSNTTS